jgi:branched-chain amino acid transport system permease protein
MNATVALFLLQDGIINGAIYALLGVTLVLVFAVTRVIFVPLGEFVAWSALTLAALEAGSVPGIAWLLLALGVAVALFELIRERHEMTNGGAARIIVRDVIMPMVLLGMVYMAVPLRLGFAAHVALTLALIIPMGPLVYRLAFQPLADATVLTLFITSIGVHFALLGTGLLFFGAEGTRTPPFIDAVYKLGSMNIKAQSLFVLAVAAATMIALYVFFERSLLGKALRATAVNRLGARLVGIPVAATGRIAFAMAALIGALCGMLIGPFTTMAYDSGFLIGLKGFIAAITGGLVSYPLTALAALGVGLLESYSAFFASAFKEVIVFSIILPVLLWRSFTSGHSEEDE